MRARARLAALAVAGLLSGIGLSASAYVTATDSTSALVDVAVLSAPDATATYSAGKVTITVSAPASNPAATTYDVTKDGVPLSCPTLPGVCVDPATIRPPTVLSYTVSARLGSNWIQSVTRSVVLAPPAITFTLSGTSDTGLKGDQITSLVRPFFAVRIPQGDRPYSLKLMRGNDVLDSRLVSAGSGTSTAQIRPSAAASFVRSLTDHYPVTTVASFVPGPGPEALTTTTPLTPAPDVQVWPAPSVTSLALADSDTGTSGVLEPGDKLTLTFSQPMLPTSFCGEFLDAVGEGNVGAGFDAEVVDGGPGGASDVLRVFTSPGLCGTGRNAIHLGSFTLGGDYVVGTVSFADCSIELDDAWTTITLTIGDLDPTSTGAASGVPVLAPGPISFIPDVGTGPVKPPTDQAGNDLTAIFTVPTGSETHF